MAIETTFLDISGEEIPVSKTYEFGGISYVFQFKENVFNDLFTVEIYDVTGENLLWSNRLVYGQTIMDSPLAPFQDSIIPLNIAVLQGNPGTTDITRQTLGNEIKLYTSVTQT